jgi:pyruvate formate lyase activating enzyme
MPFFDAGGGGVTFSGGEPLLHDTYLTRVLAKCKAEGIHTCIETAGNVRWPAFQHILKYTDLFLYDLKVMNPVKHRKYTGAGNSEILKNAERLCKVANVMFRMPIIPGYNNDRDNIARVASFLRKVEKPTIHLLPYNKLGEIKYPRLGKEFTIHINSTPNAVVVAKHKFRAHGIIAEIISY